MIPWRLTFSGVRDYPPTLMDVSGFDSHILITGPNGAGKSTISFCMGAVLYSSKVDAEGLRSRNLQANETWRAKISLLFKNDGLMKIDAPAFIEFNLYMVQEPGQPVKKGFSISKGDHIDQWEETVSYTSGDRYYNFTAYKKDLQYKYKIDPDLFYLIWYQQEVNQFAVMHPEERFRIFSEMHGIDKVQRDWEESMEKLKETEETLRSSELNVKRMKQELSMKKVALDRYVDNQNRLREGGELYIRSLLRLERHYHREKDRLFDVMQQLEAEMAELREDQALQKIQKEKVEEGMEVVKQEIVTRESEMEAARQTIDQVETELRMILERIAELDKELKDITERKSKITRSEEEVKAALQKLRMEKEETNKAYDQVKTALAERNQTWRKKVGQIAELKEKVVSAEQLEVIHQERLREYKSSHTVQAQMDALDKRIDGNKENKRSISQELRQLKDEQALLEEGRDLSARQVESMKWFRSRQIKAYPLRELIEMTETAKLQDEQLFQAIKYTVFFNGLDVNPPNDLYHVSLMKLVPDRSVTELPDLHCRVKEGLTEEEIPHAMKALWWVEQFFKGDRISIQNGILIDSVGMRGPQEKERFILSAKALQVRKQEIHRMIDQLSQKLSWIEEQIRTDTKTLQELNSIIQQVRESEAFMTKQYERTVLKNKWKEEQGNEEVLRQEIERLETEIGVYTRLQYKHGVLEEQLCEEEQFYKELGRLKDKYEERNELDKQADAKREQKKKENDKSAKLEQEIELLDGKLKQTERKIRKMSDDLENIDIGVRSRQKQKENCEHEKELAESDLVQMIKEGTEMKGLMPDLYAVVVAEHTEDRVGSLQQWKNDCERGKVIWNQARMEDGIDPAAPANYETAKNEFDRLDNEFKRTSILLEQDKERAEQLRDKMETTINMRVLEIQQRFKTYLGHFQFEGDINWESYEDHKKRVHFKLYIKVRKEGHRGSMEDVSIKARGGKVGKGVSGGEESLSSLLFALALLQNIQTAPGFIVLDEFDSALDENRKSKVFDLYVHELRRKMIVLTPKSHEQSYMNRFSKAFVVHHDPIETRSKVIGIARVEGV
ncbi:chromosome segregation protein SMC [Brevibacillus centrosporus]|uniref:chromosome segregation protein SMC n=1 Tax=Brevibacillus centrosporus TaxID=54910 RepID=UPI0039875453